jgi:hypothetical protein
MSQENVEIVRRAFENRGLEDTAETYWHPQIVYIEDPRFPGASSYRGRDAVIRRWQTYSEVLGDEESITVCVENVFDAGERQVPFVRFRGRATASGVPFDAALVRRASGVGKGCGSSASPARRLPCRRRLCVR